MLSIRPIIGAVACGALLWAGLGLSNLALSSEMASEKMGDKESGKIIKGTVLRSEGPNYFVKNKEDGKEVRLRIDKNTQIKGLGIVTGDDVVVKLDDQNHVEFISPDRNVGQHESR
jgi:hypothetical protein